LHRFTLLPAVSMSGLASGGNVVQFPRALQPNRFSHDAKLPAQFVDLSFIISILDGEIVHPAVNENPSLRNSTMPESV